MSSKSEKNSKNIKSVRDAVFTGRQVKWIFLLVRWRNVVASEEL